MKNLRFFSIFLVLVLLTGLFSSVAYAAPEDDSFEQITVAAKAALLVDGDSGQVLLEQNADAQLYPASITKCMTALLVLEAVNEGKLSLDQVVTASQTAIDMLTADSSTAGIKVGEQLTVEQLLYCVMVQSANEACYILAEAVCGDIDTFVAKMNVRAQELGCENTNYVNPCGLHDPQHYTSARDIYLVTKEAMKYSLFMTMAGTTKYVLPATNMSKERICRTTNYLLDQWRAVGYLYSPAKGIKTGHTSDAGYCLVSYAEKNDRSLIAIVLGAEAVKDENGNTKIQSFSESKRLLEWGFSDFHRTTILDKSELIEQIPVTLSRKTNYVVVHPAESVETLLPKNLSPEDLIREITLDDTSVKAPVTLDQKLGTITLKDSSGAVYVTTDLLALNDVPASKILVLLYHLELFFDHLIVKIAAVVLLVLLALAIITLLRRRPRRYRGGQSYHTRRRQNRYQGRKRRR